MALREEASALAERLQSGSVTPEVRAALIRFRTELFERGYFDPVLARIDSFTVAQPEPSEVAAQLQALAGSL